MSTFFIVNAANEIINTVLADTPELALLGAPDGAIAITELGPEHHYPEPPVITMPPEPLSKSAFWRRFTAQERIAIRASTDPLVVDFLIMVDLDDTVDMTDPEMAAGLDYLTQVCLLAAGRAEEILAG